MEDDFAAFRAAHPSVDDALAASTGLDGNRPDWLVQIAWEVLDHKLAVRLGANSARMLLNANDAIWQFTPWPDRLEPVDRWAAEQPDDIERSASIARAVCVASIPAAGLAYLIQALIFVGAWTGTRAVTYIGLIFGLDIVLAFAIRAALSAAVKRRAAALDDRAALAIVLAEMRAGAAKNPHLIPLVMQSLGGRIRRLKNGEPQ